MTHVRLRGPARRLQGTVRVPGDKSIGHRAVMFGAIADGATEVRGLSGGEDNLRTVAALRALGVPIEAQGEGALLVRGGGLHGLRQSSAELDCGNSGTSMRLLAGLLAPRPFPSRLTGDVYLQARPMRRVSVPLRQMGANVDGAAGKKPGELYPPLVVGGQPRLRGITYHSEVASAQVKSAVLLAGLYAEGPTTFFEPALSRDHTERMLGHMGAPLLRTADGLGVTVDPARWSVPRLQAQQLDVPGDFSSAAFLLAAATLVPGSALTVEQVGMNPTRLGFLDALLAMGGEVTVESLGEPGGESVGNLHCRSAGLRGIELSGALTVRAIDELPLLAVLAAHAEGETIISDAAELRVKESDRIAATVAALRAFGAEVEERPDGMRILGRGPGALHASEVESEGDHRIAMAGTICALSIAGESVIHDVDNVATSFPTFWRCLSALGAELS